MVGPMGEGRNGEDMEGICSSIDIPKRLIAMKPPTRKATAKISHKLVMLCRHVRSEKVSQHVKVLRSIQCIDCEKANDEPIVSCMFYQNLCILCRSLERRT